MNAAQASADPDDWSRGVGWTPVDWSHGVRTYPLRPPLTGAKASARLPKTGAEALAGPPVTGAEASARPPMNGHAGFTPRIHILWTCFDLRSNSIIMIINENGSTFSLTTPNVTVDGPALVVPCPNTAAH
ncbi:hypothetical protein ATANTOWER_013918 [Ataeniobius toweri]|uniref:Uncharacterized protein n=1 Tax=Ataeniobius toweri TaxID=208326 RepID=A0ABU7AFW5_9TELE|nr:hypothetical protein [Ataeniobius toweri]